MARGSFWSIVIVRGWRWCARGLIRPLIPIIKRQQPLGRMATTREVGYAVLFLASDESSALTGSALYVDGASSAAI
jgi:enoyl-[acyl-carrier-protein] reductase (NADH)